MIWYFVRIFLKQVPLHPPRLRNTARRKVKGRVIVKSGNISHFLFRTIQLSPGSLLIHFLPKNYGADEFLLAMLIGNKRLLFPRVRVPGGVWFSPQIFYRAAAVKIAVMGWFFYCLTFQVDALRSFWYLIFGLTTLGSWAMGHQSRITTKNQILGKSKIATTDQIIHLTKNFR